MGKSRTGYVYKDGSGRWWARVTHYDRSLLDEAGRPRRRNWKRRARTKGEARELLSEMLEQLAGGRRPTGSSDRTVSDLHRHWSEAYAVAPVFEHGKKVDGMKSWKSARMIGNRVLRLAPWFGAMAVRSVTDGTLRRVRRELLQSPRERGRGKRSYAIVNREMAIVRRWFTIAKRERWISTNPFGDGEPLIRMKLERERRRTLSDAEELRLLSVCAGRTAHLRPMIIVAVDTGLRWSEQARLEWRDIGWDSGEIAVRDTKSEIDRTVGMTERVVEALRAIESARMESGDHDQSSPIFPLGSVKSAWSTVRGAAGVSDLHWHDLRHTCGSRLAAAGFSLAEIGRILGHSQPSTTYRYANALSDTAQRSAAALSRRHSNASENLAEGKPN